MICIGIIILLGLLIGYVLTNRYKTTDTYYDKTVDSLLIEIDNKDSVVINLKVKIKDDSAKIKALDDSATIKLFYELVEGQ